MSLCLMRPFTLSEARSSTLLHDTIYISLSWLTEQRLKQWATSALQGLLVGTENYYENVKVGRRFRITRHDQHASLSPPQTVRK